MSMVSIVSFSLCSLPRDTIGQVDGDVGGKEESEYRARMVEKISPEPLPAPPSESVLSASLQSEPQNSAIEKQSGLESKASMTVVTPKVVTHFGGLSPFVRLIDVCVVGTIVRALFRNV